MAVLIDIKLDPDFDTMCSVCEVKFCLAWERKGGIAILSFCPFCGEEFRQT